MNKRIIPIISLILILCLCITIFAACNKDEGPAPISFGFQTHELEIEAIGVQDFELFLDIENGDGWEISITSTDIIKNAVYDKENESVSFTVDPSSASKVLHGTITLTATKDGFEPVTAVISITQNFPKKTIVKFEDSNAIFVDNKASTGVLDLFIIRADGWTISAEATGCVSQAVYNESARTVSYTVPANTKSYSLTGEIIIKAEKDGEETITDTVNVWQESTTYYLKKETQENRFTTTTKEYTYDENGQITQSTESLANVGSEPHHILTETYSYDGDNIVKTVTEVSTGKTTEKRFSYTEKENGYEEIEETKIDSVWTNTSKVTVSFQEPSEGTEITTTTKYTWKDGAWAKTDDITSTRTTETSEATISTTDTTALKYSDGLLTGGEHTVRTVFENSDQTNVVIDTLVSKIDAANTETKYSIEEITIDYDNEKGTRTETTRRGLYTGEESNIKDVEKYIYSTEYNESGSIETEERSTWETDHWAKRNTKTEVYDKNGNITDTKLEGFDYSTGNRNSFLETFYTYDDNGNMTNATEKELNPSTGEIGNATAITTYEWIAA